MYFLVDTNVFLDLFLDRGNAGDDAEAFLKSCHKYKNKIFITAMQLRDIEYVAHRYFHNKFKAKKIQADTYGACSKVIGISADSAINALFSDMDDYEDALIAEAAQEACLDAIITNNKKDFAHANINVFTPSEIVEIYEKNPPIIAD